MKKIFKKNNHSRDLVIFIAGWNGKLDDYLGYFLNPLSKKVNVYATELYMLGNVKTEKVVDHFIDEYNKLPLNNFENIYLIGHSMGSVVIINALKHLNREPNKLYFIANYPDYSECFISDNFVEKSKNFISNKAIRRNFGPVGMPVKHMHIKIPCKFVIGDKDEVLNSFSPKVMKRLIHYYKSHKDSSYKIFKKFTHCFNCKRFKFSPFNHDSPYQLLHDIRIFLKI